MPASAVGWFSTRDPHAQQPETRWAATMATDLYAGLFLGAATPPDTTIDITVAGRPHTPNGTGPTRKATLDDWIQLFWFYALSRSPQSQRAIHALPEHHVIPTGKWPEYRIHRYRALTALDNNDPTWTTHLTAAQEAITTPSYVEPDEATLLEAPILAILTTIANHDQTAFTTAVTDALHAHRTYYTAHDHRSRDCAGYTSIPIAATCALATDHGLTLTIESDYLPTGLIHPGWYPTTTPN
ncbi:immunity 49 family protein [Williamsia sp. CHRR-6]|uniref:immunity 49 family protein n=1 Tax=Williamsia sp. CHRR-6 TaxID=2835871 RepID=UPI001BDA5516|nr:immunity 49 family protein [Williamsia sp. CHRR-6]MBT0566093.1 immunity 49 family protein [Williamsia sp. CHRR-6]